MPYLFCLFGFSLGVFCAVSVIYQISKSH